MKRSCMTLGLLVLTMISLPPLASAAPPVHRDSVVTAAVHESAPVSSPNTLPFSLTALAAVIGATAPKSKKVSLSGTYLFNGESYGPGEDIEVPDDFPEIDGDTGAVVHEEGSTAARNAAISRRANAGIAPVQGLGAGAISGQGSTEPAGGETVSGMSTEQLEELSKDQLVKVAEKAGIVVEREDGDGAPLKADYVRVLGATKQD
jgi:hypothetical protein